MIPILLIQKIVQLFVVLFLGFLFVKLKLVKADDSTVLSKFSLFLLMPSAILNSFAIEMTDEVMRGLLLTFGAAIVVHLVLLLIDFIYHRFFHAQAVARASVMYSNAANLIIPIVSFVLGDEWVIYSCAYLSVQILFLWTHGVRMFSREEKFNLRKILLNVNIIAVVIGIFLLISGLQLPKMATDIIGSLGSMVGNVGMLICGMVAAKIDFRKILTNKQVYGVSALRMLVCPLIVLGILKGIEWMFPIPNAEKLLLITFLASMTPAAATVMQLAQVHNKEPEFAVSVNILTTLVCIATMPLFVLIFQAI